MKLLNLMRLRHPGKSSTGNLPERLILLSRAIKLAAADNGITISDKDAMNIVHSAYGNIVHILEVK